MIQHRVIELERLVRELTARVAVLEVEPKQAMGVSDDAPVEEMIEETGRAAED